MRILIMAAITAFALNTGAVDVPETEREEVRDTVHGVEIVDPYRWLEGSAAPEIDDDPELDERVSEWTDAQNAYTRQILDNLPGREELEARLRELMEVGSVSAPTMRRDLYFYWKREGDQAQPIMYVRQGLNGEPRVLLDPNTLDEEGLIAPSFGTPNRDGSLLAFGLYEAGDENTTLHILEVETGEWLADEIPGKVGAVDWMPGGESFFYRRLEDIDDPYSGQIKYHEVGTHHSQDPVLFEQYDEGPLATTWGPFASVSRDGRWMILGYWTGTDSNDLWVVDLDEWFRTGEFEPITIVEGEKANSFGPVVGDTLYMTTRLDAPNGRVVAVDLNHPERENWKPVIDERDDAVLESLELSRSFLVAEYLKDARSEISLHRMNGEMVRE
ncbi:MAG: hypothetical protein R3338_14465, partial [Thermoanaerobaculia bacterium]|nr:hypothetical protein [Thermoanaerobaculia bacterium]